MKQRWLTRSIGLTLLLGFSQTAFGADPGVSDKEIVIGVSNSITGPVAPSGLGLNAGAKAYIEKLNSSGGVHGRKLKVIHYDDQYEPSQTVAMTQKLIKEDQVFLLFNYQGTPTCKAVVPIVSRENVPFLFPRTGDMSTRFPFNKNIFNLRASFADEIELEVKTIISRKLTKIGIVIQPDSFGDAIKSATVAALQKHGKAGDIQKQGTAFVSEGVMQRNTTDAKDAFQKVSAGNPEVVILAVPAAAAEAFVRLAQENGKKWLYMGINSLNPLVEKLGDTTSEILISQVVPRPDSDLAIAKEFREDMKKSGQGDQINFISFEGYISARVMADALNRAGKDLSRKRLIEALEAKPFDLGGMTLSWSPESHNSSGNIFLTTIKNKALIQYK